jgi:hypothetical protein
MPLTYCYIELHLAITIISQWQTASFFQGKSCFPTCQSSMRSTSLQAGVGQHKKLEHTARTPTKLVCRHVLSLITLGCVCVWSLELKKRNWKINGTNISKSKEKSRTRQRARMSMTPGVMAHWYVHSGTLGPQSKKSWVQTRWCAGETPAGPLSMSLTSGCRWFVRLCLLGLLL